MTTEELIAKRPLPERDASRLLGSIAGPSSIDGPGVAASCYRRVRCSW